MRRPSPCLKLLGSVSLVVLFSVTRAVPAQMNSAAADKTDVAGLWEKDSGDLCVHIEAQGSGCTWEAAACGGASPTEQCTVHVVTERVEIDLDASRTLLVTRKGNNLEGSETGGAEVLLILQQCTCFY